MTAEAQVHTKGSILMETGFVKTGWITTVTPTMAAAALSKVRGRDEQPVAVDSGLRGRVIGSVVLHYVRSASRTPWAAWLYTDLAYRWEAAKVVYLDEFVPAQNVELPQNIFLPFIDGTEPAEALSFSSSGKK